MDKKKFLTISILCFWFCGRNANERKGWQGLREHTGEVSSKAEVVTHQGKVGPASSRKERASGRQTTGHVSTGSLAQVPGGAAAGGGREGANSMRWVTELAGRAQRTEARRRQVVCYNEKTGNL